MQKIQSRKLGYWGEQIAKRYLQKKGYKIIEQNYYSPYGEIDLIAWDNAGRGLIAWGNVGKGLELFPTLVFIEVKTKVGDDFGTPEEVINRNKINRLVKSALVYAAQKKYCKDYRIDAICIVLSEERNIKRLNHYQNVSF